MREQILQQEEQHQYVRLLGYLDLVDLCQVIIPEDSAHKILRHIFGQINILQSKIRRILGQHIALIGDWQEYLVCLSFHS